MTVRVRQPGCRSYRLIPSASHSSGSPAPVGEFANAPGIAPNAERKLRILSRRQQGRRMDKADQLPHRKSGSRALGRQNVGAPTFPFWNKVAA
jgi:hypothetical protein